MEHEKPSELEMQILGLLWRNGPLTAREVLNQMPDRKQRAYTSVLSALQVMDKKGFLTRTREGLTDRWRPKVKESQILQPFMKTVVSHLFGGRAAKAMQCLLGGAEVGREEIAEIRKLLDEYDGSETGVESKEKSKKRRSK
jgi:predicted transcriptional regulator